MDNGSWKWSDGSAVSADHTRGFYLLTLESNLFTLHLCLSSRTRTLDATTTTFDSVQQQTWAP